MDIEPLRWSARITHHPPAAAGTRSGGSTIFIRTGAFEVGAPLEFDRAEPRISAMEYVIGAFGADLVGSLAAVARELRVTIHAAEAAVSATLENPLVHLGVIGEAGSARLATIHAAVYVATTAPWADLEVAWVEALRRSPLVATFQGVIDLKLELKPVA